MYPLLGSVAPSETGIYVAYQTGAVARSPPRCAKPYEADSVKRLWVSPKAPDCRRQNWEPGAPGQAFWPGGQREPWGSVSGKLTRPPLCQKRSLRTFFGTGGTKVQRERGESSQGRTARRAPFCTERSAGRLGGGRAARPLTARGISPPKASKLFRAGDDRFRPRAAVRHAGERGVYVRHGPQRSGARKHAVAAGEASDAT
jgi:hypothetical protein